MNAKDREEVYLLEPLVSVVISTYHGVENIERAVKSVLSQTYPNIELIIVDDNGEGTEAQIATYNIIKKYDNIRYICHKKNKNGSAARNTGIKTAKGEYVALLDDDDAYKPDKIAKQMTSMLEENESSLCYTGMNIHYPDGRVVTVVQDSKGYLFKDVMLRKICGQTSTLLFKKEAALSIGGFDESFNRHQDWEFLDRMAYKFKFTVVPEVCVDRYFLTRNRANTPEKFEKNRIFYLKKMKPYIDLLDRDTRKQLVFGHYRAIGKEYLKQKKIAKACKYFIKCGNPIKTIADLVGDYHKSTHWKYLK